MALSGKLKIIFDDNYISLHTKTLDVNYIRYTGFYEDLPEYIDKIRACINENRLTFDKLIWSYDHMSELEGE